MKLGYNKNIEVIANGIDVNNIRLKQSWKRNDKLLFLSRIHVKKGIEFLLEAIAELKDKLKGYTIYIAGEGDTNYIKQLKEEQVYNKIQAATKQVLVEQKLDAIVDYRVIFVGGVDISDLVIQKLKSGQF